MASGSVVVKILRELPPGSSFATWDVRVGGSSPAESVMVLDFDAATVEYMDYLCRLENYGGGGLTFTLVWAATSATSGDVVWEVAVRSLVDDAEDIDAAKTYDFNSVTDTAASASGEFSYCTITFANGTDMDSWADGQMAVVRLRRNAASGADTMTGDAQLVGFFGAET